MVAPLTSVPSKPDSARLPQATPEQVRQAKLFQFKPTCEEDTVSTLVKQVMDQTGCDEDAAVIALHDVHYHLQDALELLCRQDVQENGFHPVKSKRVPAAKEAANQWTSGRDKVGRPPRDAADKKTYSGKPSLNPSSPVPRQGEQVPPVKEVIVRVRPVPHRRARMDGRSWGPSAHNYGVRRHETEQIDGWSTHTASLIETGPEDHTNDCLYEHGSLHASAGPFGRPRGAVNGRSREPRAPPRVLNSQDYVPRGRGSERRRRHPAPHSKHISGVGSIKNLLCLEKATYIVIPGEAAPVGVELPNKGTSGSEVGAQPSAAQVVTTTTQQHSPPSLLDPPPNPPSTVQSLDTSVGAKSSAASLSNRRPNCPDRRATTKGSACSDADTATEICAPLHNHLCSVPTMETVPHLDQPAHENIEQPSQADLESCVELPQHLSALTLKDHHADFLLPRYPNEQIERDHEVSVVLPPYLERVQKEHRVCVELPAHLSGRSQKTDVKFGTVFSEELMKPATPVVATSQPACTPRLSDSTSVSPPSVTFAPGLGNSVHLKVSSSSWDPAVSAFEPSPTMFFGATEASSNQPPSAYHPFPSAGPIQQHMVYPGFHPYIHMAANPPQSTSALTSTGDVSAATMDLGRSVRPLQLDPDPTVPPTMLPYICSGEPAAYLPMTHKMTAMHGATGITSVGDIRPITGSSFGTYTVDSSSRPLADGSGKVTTPYGMYTFYAPPQAGMFSPYRPPYMDFFFPTLATNGVSYPSTGDHDAPTAASSYHGMDQSATLPAPNMFNPYPYGYMFPHTMVNNPYPSSSSPSAYMPR